jgi:hypothetical protein
MRKLFITLNNVVCCTMCSTFTYASKTIIQHESHNLIVIFYIEFDCCSKESWHSLYIFSLYKLFVFFVVCYARLYNVCLVVA